MPTRENKIRYNQYLKLKPKDVPHLGWTCINTATRGRVQYNPDLYANPEKYGYTRIPYNSMWKEGDILQIGGRDPYTGQPVPYGPHAVQFDHRDGDKIYVNQSHGDWLPTTVSNANSTIHNTLNGNNTMGDGYISGED